MPLSLWFWILWAVYLLVLFQVFLPNARNLAALPSDSVMDDEVSVVFPTAPRR